MIVDGLVYLGTSHFGYSLEPADAIASMEATGTDTAIVAPVHLHHGDFTAANDFVLKAARESAERLIPLARVDPWDGATALAELRRAITDGARGLFLHPSEEHFRVNDPGLVRPLVDCAADMGVPVVIAAGFHLFSEPLQLGSAAQWAPGVPFVLTNGGQLNISGMSQFDALLTLQNANVHVQTTGMYREDFLQQVVARFGPERLLYASAVPVFDTAYERRRVALANFTDSEQHLILGGNSSRIFGIEIPS